MVNIILSPSQQTKNQCAMGDSEADHCYDIAKITYELLKDYECNVCLIPKELNYLQDVVNYSNDFVNKHPGIPSFHLDIHTDAGYNGKGSSGFYVSENGRQFISIIQREIAKVTPWLDSGVTERDNLYVLNYTSAYAGLIELSFHDRLNEAKHLHTQKDLYAQGLLSGLVKACGLVQKKKKIKIDYGFENCVEVLVKNGIIEDSKYWIVNEYYDPTFVKILIEKTARRLFQLTGV